MFAVPPPSPRAVPEEGARPNAQGLNPITIQNKFDVLKELENEVPLRLLSLQSIQTLRV